LEFIGSRTVAWAGALNGMTPPCQGQVFDQLSILSKIRP